MKGGLLLGLVGLAVACGGVARSNGNPSSDAGSGDAGALACGKATCGPTQICLFPPWGRVAFAVPEGGVCPAGTSFPANHDGCVSDPPPPACVSPTAALHSLDCSDDGAIVDCSSVNVPIPVGCSRTCRGIGL